MIPSTRQNNCMYVPCTVEIVNLTKIYPKKTDSGDCLLGRTRGSVFKPWRCTLTQKAENFWLLRISYVCGKLLYFILCWFLTKQFDGVLNFHSRMFQQITTRDGPVCLGCCAQSWYWFADFFSVVPLFRESHSGLFSVELKLKMEFEELLLVI